MQHQQCIWIDSAWNMHLPMFWRWVWLELFWEVRCYDNGPNFQFENFPPSHFCFFSTLSFCFDSCPLIIVCFLLPSTLYGVSQKRTLGAMLPLRGNSNQLLNYLLLLFYQPWSHFWQIWCCQCNDDGDDDDGDADDGAADEYEDGNHPFDCVCDMIFGCTCDRCAVAMKGLWCYCCTLFTVLHSEYIQCRVKHRSF